MLDSLENTASPFHKEEVNNRNGNEEVQVNISQLLEEANDSDQNQSCKKALFRDDGFHNGLSRISIIPLNKRSTFV